MKVGNQKYHPHGKIKMVENCRLGRWGRTAGEDYTRASQSACDQEKITGFTTTKLKLGLSMLERCNSICKSGRFSRPVPHGLS